MPTSLGQFLGSSKGLSAPVITKLTEQWKAEQRAFAERDLSGVTAKSWSGWPTATGSRPSRGRICCATAPDGAWSRRWWQLAMGYWGSGVRYARCSPSPVSSGVSSTRLPTCCRPCRNPRIRGRRKALTETNPDRVDVRHGVPPHEGHQGAGLADGVQADRVG